ncbi:tyrosine phosphatase family-domain-containing protein [Xylogone sp. PMI_703]|nr:tyrosine phosphatase family-domain-containing protein [Xylogone sp. PMI_703]
MAAVLPEEKETLSPTSTVRGFNTKGREAHISLTLDRDEWGGSLKESRNFGTVPVTTRTGALPIVDLGMNISSVFPTRGVEMEEHMADCLESSRASESNILGQPANFGPVLPGIYRSSYPQPEHFDFLRTLGLKSIITLVKSDIPEDYKAFIDSLGIKHFIIDMPGTKKEAISDSTMSSIMEIVLNPANHPILMHCNHGKHRTGCATAVIRHLSGWDVPAIIAEYEGYASPKVREVDVKYITDYQVSRLKGLFLPKRTIAMRDSNVAVIDRRMSRFLLGTIIVLMIWLSTVGVLGKH